VRDSTHRSYAHHIQRYLVPMLGGRQLADLTTPDVNALTAQLGKGKDRGGFGLAPQTVRLVHATLRVALADAVRWGLVPSNVAVGAQLPQRRRPEIKVWDATQLRTFLEATEKHALGPVFALIAHTGLRRGEAVGLRWQQVDLDRGRLLVDHQLVEQSYHLVTSGEPKTRRGHRVISLDSGTVDLLRRHRQRQDEQRSASGLSGTATYVFTRSDGEHLAPHLLTQSLPRLARQAGLPEIRLHDLRHTHATLGLAAGVPAKVMADRLGHSSVLLTLDTYSHVSPALDGAAADLIAGLISGGGRPLCDPDVTHKAMKTTDEGDG